jgi:hypothetical protein
MPNDINGFIVVGAAFKDADFAVICGVCVAKCALPIGLPIILSSVKYKTTIDFPIPHNH